MCLGNLAPSNFAVLRRVCRSFKVLLDNDDAICVPEDAFRP